MIRRSALPTVLSPRLAAIVAALPLRAGMRVLEIGCGPGALARAVAGRIGNGLIVGIDRSPKAIAQAGAACREEIMAGRLVLRCVAAEDFILAPDQPPFDIAVAIRVGALDGRHPTAGLAARQRLRAALVPDGRVFIDSGDPLLELALDV